MKISRAWLQDYIGEPLPDAAAMHDALTFHSCEVEEILADGADGGDVVMDVKVLPDRASYALSHRGMASELAAALALPLISDPYTAAPFDVSSHAHTNVSNLSVSIDDASRCSRYCAVRIDGVTVGPSPEWLRTRLEAVGQRSINNIVDATNYVMLALGQPLHAFDALKLAASDGTIAIRVRGSEAGETITVLGGTTYTLPSGTQLITNGTTNEPLAIAGIKGGIAAELDTATTSIVLEAACFDGPTTRRAAQSLKLFTDASLRFQNNVSPELVGHGMREVVELVQKIAGGHVVAAADSYAHSLQQAAPRIPVVAQLSDIAAILGTPISASDAATALTRLQLSHTIDGDTITVAPPFWRNDLTMTADLAEEIGRTLGYDRVPSTPLRRNDSLDDTTKSSNATFAGIERIRDTLVALGYTEISTPSFAETGAIHLSNPLQSDRPYLRASLAENMRTALARAKEHAPLALGPEKRVLLFELGTVFTEQGEHFSLALGYEPLSEKRSAGVFAQAIDALKDVLHSSAAAITYPTLAPDQSVVEISLAAADFDAVGTSAASDSEQIQKTLGMFKPFSPYPFATRDVAVWVPSEMQQSEVAMLMQSAASEHLVRMDCFDRFEKEGRTSYAFRLIFQSQERTLTEDDLEPATKAIYDAIAAKDGWEAR